MRRLIKQLVYTAMDGSGYNYYKRLQQKNAVLILTYHSVLPWSQKFERFDFRNCVSQENFAGQIDFLKQNYQVITLQEAVQRLREERVDQRCAVITFDDGLQNNYRYAFPVLQSKGVSAMFYITTGLIGSQGLIWTEKVTLALQLSTKKKIKLKLDTLQEFDLSSQKNIMRASIRIRNYMKAKSFTEVQAILQELEELCEVDEAVLGEESDRYAFMSWNEVKEMDRAGMEIGSHTETHRLLNMIDAQSSFDELKTSKEKIEQALQKPCDHFSYPNGTPANFTEMHIGQLKSLGYKSATTQVRGFNTAETNPYALHRINITSKMNSVVFRAHASGNYQLPDKRQIMLRQGTMTQNWISGILK